jgi:hypothetical protein
MAEASTEALIEIYFVQSLSKSAGIFLLMYNLSQKKRPRAFFV